MGRLIDWLIDGSIDWLIGRLIDWLIDGSIDWSIDEWIDWLMGGLIDWLMGGLIDWLIDPDISFLVWNCSNFLGRCVQRIIYMPRGKLIFSRFFRYTNVMGIDPDLPVTKVGDIRRVCAQQTWMQRYRFQYIYLCVLYGFLAIKFRLQDITDTIVDQSNGKIRVNNLGWTETAGQLLSKTVWAFWRFYLPLFVFHVHPASFLALSLLAEIVTGYYLTFNFQVSHVTPVVDFPEGERGSFVKEWAQSQVATTLDYGYDSKVLFTKHFHLHWNVSLYENHCQKSIGFLSVFWRKEPPSYIVNKLAVKTWSFLLYFSLCCSFQPIEVLSWKWSIQSIIFNFNNFFLSISKIFFKIQNIFSSKF